MSIDNTQDLIDSREVIERIRELTEGVEELTDTIGSNTAPDDYVSEREDLGEYQRELRHLWSLAAEAERSPDWRYGETLIRDTYFEDYARQLAEDVGAIDPDAGWPNGYIDWGRAVDALKMDYFAVDFAGETYWIRS